MNPNVSLQGKVALVTGSGRGIGRGCAIELARAGADVVINDRPDSPDLAETRQEIVALGRKCTAIGGDIFSRAGCERLLHETLAAHGQLNILVSNPAYSQRGEFLTYDPIAFEKTLQGTLIAGFHMSQLAAQQMVKQGVGGKMVFISSVHAEMPYARSCAYNAAKAGLNHLMRTIATELTAHRINVNAIEPGWIDTPGERITFGEAKMKEISPTLPWGRLGTIHDIGHAAAFLCSDAADYVTGSILRVDGGFVLKDCRASSNC